VNDQLERLNRLPLRSNLRGLTPYGAPQLDVPILLNVNENTHGVPADVRAAISAAVSEAAAGLNRYPDREFSELREALAEYLGHGLDATNIWAANGSNEVLQQILQAFGGPGRTALGFPPTYSMYPLLASGTDTKYIVGQRAEGYGLSAESAAQQVKELQPNIVFLSSPNNPTGTGLGLDVVEGVYAAGEASQTVVIVSKAFALAGARLGYMAAAPEVTDALRLVRLPYHLSAVTQATALAALQHREALMADVEDIKKQRDRIVSELTRMGLNPAASDSNFVFFGGLDRPHDVWQQLLDAGVLIRDVGIPGHLRVTAGTETETTAFLTSLEAILASQAKLPA
jgi:histidinol-phosphate aminotransferase